ncbi:hypothetical protein ER308_01255 [Egibacter rhizosphaerae]|uniref:Pyruvate, phosphate dikinase n=1 Tax=Egibacter rhizosphaerae TaxID=1670831 RepID=A0A411YAU9_9ACTN|nr:putative PEP-binding protein [Egibacter rhizosphaerae]QBI18331.1 hypothetical protein ER308_01255 [Egibacter rhizosphaerae]
MLAAARARSEVNPTLGARGCRLGILRPELYRMQVRALLEAAAELKGGGYAPDVEIMVPLVAHVNELERIASWIDEEARVTLEGGPAVSYRIGTMIETPRAALTSGAIASRATFFSFGTNDLVQMTWGFSRDDLERAVIPRYLEEGIIPVNPFGTLDQEGVGRLVVISVAEGRATRPELEAGMCGEHGGDPASIRLAHEAGLDYVSCSPFRIPVARLAAAHAALGGEADDASA